MLGMHSLWIVSPPILRAGALVEEQKADNQAYKVIDCTWSHFRVETKEHMPAWFTCSNVDIRRTHKPGLMRGGAPLHFPSKSFFIEQQVHMPSSGDIFCIDHTSVEPQPFAVLYGARIDFKFK